MKKGLIALLLASSMFAKAQTLKDALFSGKLKNQPGAVIRKGDDLSAKIDTSRTVATDETGKTNTTVPVADASTESAANKSDSISNKNDNGTAAIDAANPNATNTAAAAPKNNNAILKTYMDSVISSLKSDALSSKKIKHGAYFVLVTYSIATDGQLTVNDVSVSPENAFLLQQIKEKLDVDTPRLSPVLSDSGAPRKVTRKYNFTLSKQ